ncbi:hypothetical protein BDP67DRAFT_52874 [Colletotrichum lupini]|nr:hypothetical protein BDP67DRAFT_52874 [Colletotrichum lupini]
MNPLGARTLSPVETPSDGYIDDLPPTMFAKLAPRSNGFVNARDVEYIWRNNFIVLMMYSSSHLILPGCLWRPYILLHRYCSAPIDALAAPHYSRLL